MVPQICSVSHILQNILLCVQQNKEIQRNFLKNAGLNTTQRWVKYGQTQRLGCFDPAVGLLPRRLG